MPEYDPLDYGTWPEDQKDFAGRVIIGLRDGDLRPLAQYLRAGHALEPAMASELADAIEGSDWSPFRIVAKGRRRGERGWTARVDAHERKMSIGVFVEGRLRNGIKGSYDAVLAEAAGHFNVGSTTVTDAHRYLREYIEQSDTKPGFDLFAHLSDIYSGR